MEFCLKAEKASWKLFILQVPTAAESIGKEHIIIEADSYYRAMSTNPKLDKRLNVRIKSQHLHILQ